MDIRDPLGPLTRAQWRAWLEDNHASRTEAWLLSTTRAGAHGGTLTYLEGVEEALCFGWIDGLAKRHGDCFAQRFTPRRPGGNWTELNKERVRRLLAAGRMTPAGLRVAPDLDPAAFRFSEDVLAALAAAPPALENFQRFPPLYQRIRAANIEECRRKDPAEFQRRLAKLVETARRGLTYGAWEDEKLPRSGG